MWLVCILVTVCWFVGNHSALSAFPYQRQHIAMLQTLIYHERLPTTFVMLTKWSLAERMHFMRNIGIGSQFQSMQDNVTVSQLINRNTVVFVVDLDASYSLEYLENQVNVMYFSFPFRWVMLRSNRSDEQITEIPALVDSNILLATWRTENQTFFLEQFYRTEPAAGTIYEPFGHWSPSLGLVDRRQSRILARRRRNLHAMPMQASVVVVNNDTFDHLTDYRNPHIDSVSKVVYVLVSTLMDTLNATRRFKFVDTWGYVDPVTNQINGMLGDVLARRSIISGTSVFFLPERVALYEYIAMVTPTGNKFIFRAPPLSYVANIYSLPFSGTVWFASVIVVASCCLCIYTTICGQQATQKLGNKTVEQVRPSDVAMLGVGAVCQMGSTLEARRLSGKVSTIFFLVFMLFMYTSYTANIVSLLQATTKSIRTLDDLLHSKMEFGVLDIPYNRWFVTNIAGPTRRAIYETKIAPPNQPAKFVNQTYGVARMREGLYAYHGEPGPTYRLVENTFDEFEKCGLIEIDYLGIPYPWIIIQKHSPYKEILKTNLFRLRELGIQDREINKIYTKRPICTAGGQSFQSIRLIDCYFVLQVLVIGFGMSSAIFVIEKLVHIRCRGKPLEAMCVHT